MFYTYYNAPFGILRLASNGNALTELRFPNAFTVGATPEHWVASDSPFSEAISQLDDYFKGKRLAFNLPLDPSGTSFQKDVLKALQTIPYGDTRSYADIARDVGRPKAVRAVGAANGRNPIAIIIPCHRVIGKNGSLTGFGGGLALKQWLLDLEAEYYFGP